MPQEAAEIEIPAAPIPQQDELTNRLKIILPTLDRVGKVEIDGHEFYDLRFKQSVEVAKHSSLAGSMIEAFNTFFPQATLYEISLYVDNVDGPPATHMDCITTFRIPAINFGSTPELHTLALDDLRKNFAPKIQAIQNEFRAERGLLESGTGR